MNGVIFYARVSTEEQNEARQIETAKQLNADKVFLDKMSGSNASRPQLKAMLDYVREGDTVIVSEFSRLARSVKDMLTIVDKLDKKGVKLISTKENINTGTPQGKFMLTVFAALAELERETILQRQREGIAIAKAEGKYKGRKQKPFDIVKLRSECKKWRSGMQNAKTTAAACGMKPNTFYRRVKELGL